MNRDSKKLALFYQALANERRLEILFYLEKGPKNPSEIAKDLKIPYSRVSNYIVEMERVGLVKKTRDGYNVIAESLVRISPEGKVNFV